MNIRYPLVVLSFAVLSAVPSRAEEQTVAYLAPDGNTHTQWISTGVRLVGNARKTCTRELWIYPLSRSSAQNLCEQYGGNSGRETFQITSGNSGGYVSMHMNGYDPTPSVKSTHQVPLNQWTHIALVIDGDDWRIYINGELDGESSGHAEHLLDATSADGFVIGNSRSTSPNGSSNAYFAEVRVWTTARTEAQIKEFMNKRIENAYLQYDLIGYWPLNDGNAVYEANGRKVRNHAGSRNEFSPSSSNWSWCYASGNRVSWVTSDLPVAGTLAGDQYTWYINGQGADNDARAGKALTTTLTDAPADYTIMGWIRLVNSTFENVLFAKMGSNVGRLKIVRTSQGEISVWTGGDGSRPTKSMAVADIPYQVWMHVAVVKSGSNMKIYVNGELKGESDDMPYALTNDRFTIGGFQTPNSRGHSCCAYRNVGFWGKALDADAIRERMSKIPRANEPKLIGYWPLDDGRGKNEARNLVVGGPSATAIAGVSLEWQGGANLPVFAGETVPKGLMVVVR